MSPSTKIWMPFYPADYLADTQHLNTEMHGAYLLLLLAYWTRQGPLRDSDPELAQICRMPLRRWLSSRPTLSAFFTVQDGFWIQGRCERELAEARRTKEAAKKGAQLTNAKRWATRERVAAPSPSDRIATRERVAAPVVSESLNGRSSPSPSPSEEFPPSPPNIQEPSPGDFTGFGGAGQNRVPDVDGAQLPSLDQVGEVWAIWPKKVDTMQALTAIRGAIHRHGLDRVLEGTRKVVAADSQRKAAPPGRYLPKPVEFFEGDRFLDDPAQYGPREAGADVQTLRRRVEDLKGQLAEHPGNPANTEGSIERKKEARAEFMALREALREAQDQLNILLKESNG